MSARTVRGEAKVVGCKARINAEVSTTLLQSMVLGWANLTDLETGVQVMSTAVPNVEPLRVTYYHINAN